MRNLWHPSWMSEFSAVVFVASLMQTVGERPEEEEEEILNLYSITSCRVRTENRLQIHSRHDLEGHWDNSEDESLSTQVKPVVNEGPAQLQPRALVLETLRRVGTRGEDDAASYVI